MKYSIKKIIPNHIRNFIGAKKSHYKKFLIYYRKGLKPRYSTGLSDNQIYPDFCNKASSDLRTFSNFRRNKIYKMVLEHVNYELGGEYLKLIRNNNKNLIREMELFRQNDHWGNPILFEYPEIGKISPSTLRYIKVLGDLISLFKRIDGLKICEIGVGYGGQCRIINSITSPSEYILVDIKPALNLTQAYLDNYILNSIIKYTTMNELKIQNYDLLISNFAFSELPRRIQDVYLKKIIFNSKRGYITYNEIVPESFNSYKKEELLEIIPNSHIIEEKPLTHEKNCIIIWGDELK